MELMQRSIDNDLAEAEQTVLSAHLQMCPECAALYGRLQRLSYDLEHLPKVVPPVSIVEAILPKLAGLEPEPAEGGEARQPAIPAETKRKPGFFPSWKVIGGVAAAAVAIGIVLFQQNVPKQNADGLLSQAFRASNKSSADSAPTAEQKKGQDAAAPAARSQSAATGMADKSAALTSPAPSDGDAVKKMAGAGGTPVSTNTSATSAPTPTPAPKYEVVASQSSPAHEEKAEDDKADAAGGGGNAKATPDSSGGGTLDVAGDGAKQQTHFTYNQPTTTSPTPSPESGGASSADKNKIAPPLADALPGPTPAPGPESAGMASLAQQQAPQTLQSADGEYTATVVAVQQIIIVTDRSGKEIVRSAPWAPSDSGMLLSWNGAQLRYSVVPADAEQTPKVRVLDAKQRTDKAAAE